MCRQSGFMMCETGPLIELASSTMAIEREETRGCEIKLPADPESRGNKRDTEWLATIKDPWIQNWSDWEDKLEGKPFALGFLSWHREQSGMRCWGRGETRCTLLLRCWSRAMVRLIKAFRSLLSYVRPPQCELLGLVHSGKQRRGLAFSHSQQLGYGSSPSNLLRMNCLVATPRDFGCRTAPGLGGQIPPETGGKTPHSQ